MSARAPAAIYKLWDDIDKAIPRAVLSGIVGDVNHSFGYHLARRDLPHGDYSVTLARDKLGPSDAASALDVKLPTDLMKTVTGRLLAAAKAKDSRLHALREFCGTLNGTQTYPWDLSTNRSEGVNSWDDTHLWHIHLSFYREYADDYAALAPIAQVFAGVAAPKPPPVKTPTAARLRRAWPAYMHTGDYFGLITGPAQSHGGYVAQERADVKAIQQRLQALKFAPATAGWADGKFEQATKDAVTKFQHARLPGTTLFGQVWHDDWNKLFTY